MEKEEKVKMDGFGNRKGGNLGRKERDWKRWRNDGESKIDRSLEKKNL